MRLEFDITDEILFSGYIASKNSHGMDDISFAEFKEKMEKFDVWGIVDDEPVGIIVFDGNCAHISILEKFYGRCGFIIKRALNLAIKKYGSLIGLVYNDDSKALDFDKRLGFKEIGHTNEYTIFYKD